MEHGTAHVESAHLPIDPFVNGRASFAIKWQLWSNNPPRLCYSGHRTCCFLEESWSEPLRRVNLTHKPIDQLDKERIFLVIEKQLLLTLLQLRKHYRVSASLEFAMDDIDTDSKGRQIGTCVLLSLRLIDSPCVDCSNMLSSAVLVRSLVVASDRNHTTRRRDLHRQR